MVAGALLGDHEVRIADLLDPGSLERELRSFQPEACGISCSFTVDTEQTINIAEVLRSSSASPFVFVGGHHAALNPTDFARPAIDAVVLGEGEGVVPEMIEAIPDGLPALLHVPGLALNTHVGQTLTGSRQLLENLNELPLPVRSLSAPWRRRYHLGFRGPVASLETARGCPYRCRFCSVWQFYRGRYRAKAAERVVEEIEAIDESHVLVTDDNFLANPSRAEAIAYLLRARKIRKRFVIQARTDSIARHPELISLWRTAGLGSVFVGLEKIDEAGLESVQKANTVESNEAALRVLSRAGVSATASFIVDPGFDRSDFQRLRDYVRRWRLRGASFTVLTPLPGTGLFHELRSSLTTRDPELFDLQHAVLPTKLDPRVFYQEFSSLYASVYSLRNMLSIDNLWHLLAGLRRSRVPTARLLLQTRSAIKYLTDPDEYLAAHQPAVAGPDRLQP